MYFPACFGKPIKLFTGRRMLWNLYIMCEECFVGNTSLKTPNASNILASDNIDNISCVFKTASTSPEVVAWSVTIVKGEKAYCEDTTGVRRETPGLTTLEICNAE
jgi:hypothetical protein